LNATGTLLVRVPITQDTELDSGETFQLTATDSGGRTSTGIATIKDDGTGTLYTDQNPVGDTPPVSPEGSFEESVLPDASPSVGLFEALQDLTVAIRAGDHKRMDRGLGELDRMMNRLTFNISEVGTDLHVADMQTEVVEETQIQLKGVLSNAQDLDYAEAVTRMQKQMLSLEAAQRSFAQISRLSLFDYIN
jgi:flagellin-like hook-associated protein FlgL